MTEAMPKIPSHSPELWLNFDCTTRSSFRDVQLYIWWQFVVSETWVNILNHWCALALCFEYLVLSLSFWSLLVSEYKQIVCVWRRILTELVRRQMANSGFGHFKRFLNIYPQTHTRHLRRIQIDWKHINDIKS